MLKLIVAVIAGYLTSVVFVVLMFALLGASAVTPLGMSVLVAGGFCAAVAGGFVAGLIARNAPLKSGMALAVFMALMAVISMVMNWGAQPFWFQVALVLIASGAALGGATRAKLTRLAGRIT